MNLVPVHILIYGVRNSALEHCRNIKLSKYVHQTLIYTIYTNCKLLHLSDFALCINFFYLEWGLYLSFAEHGWKMKMKFRIQLHLTLITKIKI